MEGINHLVCQYNTINNNATILNGDDFLQQILSVLATLSDIDISTNQDNDDNDNENDELVVTIWKILLGEGILITCEKGTNNVYEDMTMRHSWEQGLVLISRLVVRDKRLSATELHAVMMTSCIENFGPRNIGNNSNNCCYRITCLLLCCHAIRQCPTPVDQRWKRWQSILLETIRLHQQFGVFTSLRVAASCVALWCDHIVPALAYLQLNLMMGTIPIDQTHILCIPRCMTYEAGTIFSATWLACNVMFCQPDGIAKESADANVREALVKRLFDSLYCHFLSGQYEILYDHLWRKAYSFRSRVESPVSALAYWTTNCNTHENDEEIEQRRDEVLGVKTVWSDVGVAILAAQGWLQRPRIWTINYQWNLFFPHVTVLLSGQNDLTDTMDDTTENEKEDYNSSMNTIHLGVDLLQSLLNQTPDRSKQAPRNRSSPDSPITACQLIANQVVNTISHKAKVKQQQEQPSIQSSYGAKPFTSDSFGWFQLIKTLVGKYIPIDQVRIVLTLYADCCHTGIRPMLIDLLRMYVAWDDTVGEQKVWTFVNTELIAHLSNHIKISYSTSKKTSIVAIVHMEELIHNLELYTAALGLIEVWLVGKQNRLPSTDDNTNLQERLMQIYYAVQQWMNEHLDDEASTSIDSYRLNLLEHSLQRIVDRLTSV